MDTFEGRTAIVTGAASGIGRGLAEHFAAQGMPVVLADIEQDADAIRARRLHVFTDAEFLPPFQARVQTIVDSFPKG